MKKIAICATKGGVGKTTLTANLGAIIASSGYRVLLVDADPQPSLSSFYQLAESSGKTGLTELLTSSRTPEPARTAVEGLHIITSDDPQGSLEHQLLHIPDGRLRMLQALMCIYIAIPIAVPFAVLKPSLLLFFTSAIFTLKFMTGLWALAALLDDKLIKYMYGEDEIHTGMGSTEDMVLMIVTETAYIALPVVWIWLVSGFTGSSISGVNSLFAYTAGKLDSAGQTGQSATVSAAKSQFSSKDKDKDEDNA